MNENKKIPYLLIVIAVIIVIAIFWFVASSGRRSGIKESTDYAIDIIGKETISNKPRPLGEIQIKGQNKLFVAGWAADTIAKLPAGGVDINIDGNYYPAKYGMKRPDVAKAYDIPAYELTGFNVLIPVSAIGKGKHLLSIRVLTNDKKRSFPAEEIIKINIL